MASATTSEHELIRNVIALYSEALDEKNWEKLDRVLTPDVSVEYPAPLDVYKSIPACQAGIKKAISHLSTFHALSTQTIELTSATTATARTGITANHYLGDKFFISQARYDDDLVKGNFDGVEGWRIKRRVVIIRGIPQGDWSLLH